MVGKQEVYRVLEGYNKDDLAIATVCSHSSLQIFDGARKEGLKTIGICLGAPPKFYDAFPLAKPSEFFSLDTGDYEQALTGSDDDAKKAALKEIYGTILERVDELAEKNAIIIPHGSFVEYMGAENFKKMKLPTYGNRDVLEWESDREKSRKWLESAGVKMPKKIKTPEDIDRPIIVKYYGAKGGKGFFVARSHEDFQKKINHGEKYIMQEFVLGTRYYFHYFYSPIKEDGYTLSKGSLQLLGIDKRIESNADELFRVGSPTELMDSGITPSFVVTGNTPLIVRESLLPKIFDMGAQTVEKSFDLFGGMIGPFCLESVITDQGEIKVFEISARIVAGTNLFVSGSPYSDLIEENLSCGKRIVQEIKLAKDTDRLEEIIS